MAKHSPDLAQAVVDSNALETLVPCLEEFDPTVKEAAAWAIGYIAQHTPGTSLLKFLFSQLLILTYPIQNKSLRSTLSTLDLFLFLCSAYKSPRLH